MFFELFYVVENDDTLNASFQRNFFIGARTNTLLHYNAVVLNVRRLVCNKNKPELDSLYY